MFEPDAGGGDVVTLTGDSNSAFNFGADATAYHYANSDGTFDERDNNSTPIQIHSSTDWIIPNGSAPGSYGIRYQNMTGDTGDYVGSITTTYAALTANRYAAVRDTTTGFGGKSIDYDLEIDDGSVSQDTGAYSLDADREDF